MSKIDHDLDNLIHEMVSDVISIDRPNKEKICNFVVNLVMNGGRKEQAAIDAGYGKSHAGVEANRLLSNDKIRAVYERFLTQRFVAEIFRKTLTKEHLVNMCYQIAQRSFNTAPSQAVRAIEQICKMLGYYEPIETKAVSDPQLLEQLAKVPHIIAAFQQATDSNPSEQVDAVL